MWAHHPRLTAFDAVRKITLCVNILHLPRAAGNECLEPKKMFSQSKTWTLTWIQHQCNICVTKEENTFAFQWIFLIFGKRMWEILREQLASLKTILLSLVSWRWPTVPRAIGQPSTDWKRNLGGKSNKTFPLLPIIEHLVQFTLYH